MPNPELVIRGQRVVTGNSVAPASVHITRGYISSISIFEDIPADSEVIEAGAESVVMPGLVDTHVHVNEPGRTEWEGFESATRAAGCAFETFPLGPARLVDVDVSINQPRHDNGFGAGFDHFAVRGNVFEYRNR